MDIREELENGLKEIREELGTDVKLKHSGGEYFIVRGIVYNTDESIISPEGVKSNSIYVNVLYSDLKEAEAPVRSYIEIEVERKKYVVVAESQKTSWGRVMRLDGKLIG